MFKKRPFSPAPLLPCSPALCLLPSPRKLIAWLAAASSSWLAIAPAAALAETARLDISLTSQNGESYSTLLRRAEAASRAAVQRSFDRDILVTDVAVTVSAENAGSVAPILSLQVSRADWQQSPDPQQWISYFPGAGSLLGFGRSPAPSSKPQAPTPAVSSPSSPPAAIANPNTLPPAPSMPQLPSAPANNPTASPAPASSPTPGLTLPSNTPIRLPQLPSSLPTLPPNP